MRTLPNMISYTALVAVLFPNIATPLLSRRAVNDPVGQYLSLMCLPRFTNATGLSANGRVAALADSPFPCERGMYIEATCFANGTTEIDFLAEQQCLCGGDYFALEHGCDACYFAHGFQNGTYEEASSSVSSLSLAECTPTPPFQPYSNLLPALNATEIRNRPPLTLGEDKFPNNTEVSNYWTGLGHDPTAGSITGSATARQTSWTNTGGSRFTPTSTPPSSSVGATGTSTETMMGTTSGSAASSSTAGTNAAKREGTAAVRWFLVVMGCGAIALL